MKLKYLSIQDLSYNIDVWFALYDHFAYYIKDKSDYSELTEEEKRIISEDTWNKITYKS